MARKPTRKQLQAYENKRKSAALWKLIQSFVGAELKRGAIPDLDPEAQAEISEAKAKLLVPKGEAQSEAYRELSVIVDGLGVLPLSEVPDEIIRREYHSRVKVGRKRNPPTHHCKHCDTLFYRDDYRRHSRTKCAELHAGKPTGKYNSHDSTHSYAPPIPQVPGFMPYIQAKTAGYRAIEQARGLRFFEAA